MVLINSSFFNSTSYVMLYIYIIIYTYKSYAVPGAWCDPCSGSSQVGHAAGIGSFFPECVARVPVSLGGLGVRLCSPSFAFAFATVRKCPQPSACPP